MLWCASPSHVPSSVLGCVGIKFPQKKKQKTSEAAAEPAVLAAAAEPAVLVAAAEPTAATAVSTNEAG